MTPVVGLKFKPQYCQKQKKKERKRNKGQACYCIPIIPATQEAEAGRF
jgi:hypothetical protein